MLTTIMHDKPPSSPLPFPPDTILPLPLGCSNRSQQRLCLRRRFRPISANPATALPPRLHEPTPHLPAHLPIASTRPRTLPFVGNLNDNTRCRLPPLRRHPMVASDRLLPS